MNYLADRVFPCLLFKRASYEGQIGGLGTRDCAKNSSGSGRLQSGVPIPSCPVVRVIVF